MRPATLGALVAAHDAFLIDQFGVLLDGSGAYPYAPRALARLAEAGKPVILLSNSGKRAEANAERLVALGFARESFRLVLSSGEAAWRALQGRIGAGLAPGAGVWLHARGGAEDQIAGLDLRRATSPDAADLLLLAGSRGDEMTLAQYEALLRPAAARGVPMLCTNPDIEMMTPLGLRFGAGRIAQSYVAMGGAVEWIGKPYPLIYAEAAALLPGIRPACILCIGDSPAHDVAGGQAAGHATALVQTGLHAGMGRAALADLCQGAGAVPDYLLPAFDFEPWERA